MKHKMGENIALEWKNERFYDELQLALNRIESDREKSLHILHDLTEKGSPLAMVYLGGIYLYGKYSVAKDVERANELLTDAFNRGSVEGGYILASSLFNQGKVEQSVCIYEELSNRNYSPAQFTLGTIYYNGKGVCKNLFKGKHFIDLAASNGHYYAKSWKYDITYFKNSPIYSKIIWCCAKLVLVLIHLPSVTRYPRSDRFRR
jgi:TPR repeat protein